MSNRSRFVAAIATTAIVAFSFLTLAATAAAGDANRLAYLDENNPYYVHRGFARLTTPQWVGEEGVEAVVVLAIDDMRDPARYEAFFRPILDRLKRIDGRAPLSIMTCNIDPASPQIQAWLKEGLSIEVHTVDHPCPLLQKNNFSAAKSTVDRCIDLVGQIADSQPVAFRMPCCDSLNTVSPRFYAEIFNKTTAAGNYLALDSSVFNVLTSNDPALPRELVIDADGQDKFRKYLPADRTFANTIEDYPYPYVINRLCWEFPCLAPSDWSAQHRQKPFNPVTVQDWKAALDVTVVEQGVLNLVFHPHGWIKAEQVVDLIDHAEKTHGRKVKFLTFREAYDRLTQGLLEGTPLRDEKGGDNGVRLVDVNGDGFMDVVSLNRKWPVTKVWSPKDRAWKKTSTPLPGDVPPEGFFPGHVRFSVIDETGAATMLYGSGEKSLAATFRGGEWVIEADGMTRLPRAAGHRPIETNDGGKDAGLRLRDLDGDGTCELLIGNSRQSGVFRWLKADKRWDKLPFELPDGVTLVSETGRDRGVRLVDLDDDGRDDVLLSNAVRYGAWLWDSPETGWSRKVVAATRGMTDAAKAIPPFVRADGTDNGAWFHSRHVFVQNEDTAALPDLVDRRSFHAILALSELPPRPLDPAAALRSLKPRDGFVVELVAAEPLVMDPVAFAFGPDGKLWVAEMADYPLGIDGQGKPGGRVRFLEDRDGDGKYETSTLFLEDVPFPTGVMPWRKGVLVTAAPDVIYAEDLDGDGKADRRLSLFTGFSEGNQQHRVNGLVWGLDNWVHLANGDSGGKVKSLKTGQEVNISGRDIRIRPDDGAIDVTTGQAQFGRCRDDWGDWFGCNNSRPMYHYVLDDYYLRRNPHFAPPDPRSDVSVAPGAAPVFPASRTVERFNDFDRANRFTSACSVTIYRDSLFGPAFAGNAFLSEPVHNLVHREVMREDGVTFKSQRAPDEQRSEFLVSTDNWFRPTTIQTGPDGALWIADMYRHVIEHPQWIPDHWQKRLDLRAGHDRGRIYRVYPVGQKPRPVPRLDKLDTAQLVAALDTESGWQRDMAQQLLIQRADKSAVPLLEQQAAGSARPLCRLHSLGTLDGLAAISPVTLVRGLKDEHPGVRRHAARLCENLKERPAELLQKLAALADDPDPAVRMQVAYTLGAVADRSSGVVLGRMLSADGGDRFLVAAIMSSVHKGNIDGLLAEFLQNTPPDESTRHHLDALLAVAAGLKSDSALATLLEAVTQPTEGRHATWQFAALATLLDALARHNRPLEKLQKDGDSRLRATLSRLPTLFSAARMLAADASAAESDRAAAVAVLGRGPNGVEPDLDLFSVLLSPQSAPSLQQAAVSALARVRHDRVPAILLARWKESSPTLRPQLLDALLAREAWHGPLLAALESGDMEASALDAARRQRLLDSKVVDMRNRAQKLFAVASSSDRQKIIAQYQSALAGKADLDRGATLFQKTCSVCHKLGGIGHEVGPDLAALADKSPEALLVAVLDPNRAVESRYTAYTVLTKDGVSTTGLLSAETTASITLKAQEGKELTVLRGDIEQLASSGKSTMPEGIEKDLKAQDLADIIAYVRTKVPLPPRKTFAGNDPALVRPAADGSLLLDTSTCEIYGSTLVLEETYKNLGYWSSLDDQAVWRIEVPKDGRYAVHLDWACHTGTAVNTALIESAGRVLAVKVGGTGTWDDYRQAEVGTMELSAGQHRLVMQADRRIQGALIDLRSIKLVPK